MHIVLIVPIWVPLALIQSEVVHSTTKVAYILQIQFVLWFHLRGHSRVSRNMVVCGTRFISKTGFLIGLCVTVCRILSTHCKRLEQCKIAGMFHLRELQVLHRICVVGTDREVVGKLACFSLLDATWLLTCNNMTCLTRHTVHRASPNRGTEVKSAFATEHKHQCRGIKSSLAPRQLKPPATFLNQVLAWWQIKKTMLWCSSTAITIAEWWKTRVGRHLWWGNEVSDKHSRIWIPQDNPCSC